MVVLPYLEPQNEQQEENVQKENDNNGNLKKKLIMKADKFKKFKIQKNKKIFS